MIRRFFHWGRVVCCMVLLGTGCSGNSFYSSVPTVRVFMDINILTDDPHFVTSNIGAYKIYTEKRFDTDYLGFCGLLIYIAQDARYYAWDLACPNDLMRIEPDGKNTAMFAKCPQCKEEYDLTYGVANPVKGIGREALRRYSATFDGTTLRIRN